MSITYTPTTNFGSKDSLPSNDPNKVIRGAEFTTEFTAIQSAFGLAAPASNPTFTGTATFDNVTASTVSLGSVTASSLTVNGAFTSLGIDDNATSTAITIDASKNVGIGTTNPKTALDIIDGSAARIYLGTSDSDFGGLVYSGGVMSMRGVGQGTAAVVSADATNSKVSITTAGVADRVVVNSTGNVGIGTDNPTSAMLTVRDAGLSTAFSGNIGARVESNGAGYSSTLQLSNNVDASAAISLVNGGLGLGIGTSEKLRITAAGNVGIGTAAPDLDGDQGMHLYAGGTTQVLRLQRGNGSDFSIKAGSTLTAIGTATNSPIVFRTNGTNERLRINASGTTQVTGGFEAAQPGAGAYAFAAGSDAGKTAQGQYGVAIGRRAGETTQGSDTVAIGVLAGNNTQGTSAVAIGPSAGQTSQGDNATAFGYLAGQTNQGTNAVAVGNSAGKAGQGNSSVAVGTSAGNDNQGLRGTAVGPAAGQINQGTDAVAIGYAAGGTGQGSNSIAIGNRAGQSNQGANGIIINSRGTAVNLTNANHIYLSSGSNNYLTYNGTDTWEFAGGNVKVGGEIISNSGAFANGLVGLGSTSHGIRRGTAATISDDNDVEIFSSGSNPSIWLTPDSDSGRGLYGVRQDGLHRWFKQTGYYGSGAESMRLDGAGYFMVGKTSADFSLVGFHVGAGSPGVGHFTASNTEPLVIRRNSGTTSAGVVRFFREGNAAGVINAASGQAPAFAASSDIRLKDDVVDHESELANVMALRPTRWDWKDSELGTGEGFIAQELEQTAWSDLVSEGDDGFKQVSGLGVVETRLIKALQEAVGRIESLEAEVEALKNA